MSAFDDLTKDLSPILTNFSKSEAKLAEAVQKREIYSVTIDSYESLDYPVVRHIFYGRSEKEAFAYVEAHKDTDKFFRGCQKGSFEGMKCKNTRPLVKKVQPAQIRASGLPKPSMLQKDAIKGQLARKIGV